jgi:hypothetical protein
MPLLKRQRPRESKSRFCSGPRKSGYLPFTKKESSALRKCYTAVPIDKPNPITGELKYWIPYLQVRLGKSHAISRAPVLAIVDTGSPYCIFRADIAAAIGIRDIKTGESGEIGSVKKGIKDKCYFHRIKLYIEAFAPIEVKAAFTENLSVAALLGRYGFFDHFS